MKFLAIAVGVLAAFSSCEDDSRVRARSRRTTTRPARRVMNEPPTDHACSYVMLEKKDYRSFARAFSSFPTTASTCPRVSSR